MNHFDIAIVGGSTIGLSLALALASLPLRIALIERQPFTKVEDDDTIDNKVFAITRASELFFKKLGVWQDIISQRFCAYENMQVWDSELNGRIRFHACDYFEPNLGFIIEQKIINQALLAKLKRIEQVHCIVDTVIGLSKQAKGMEVALENETIQADLVIGADGGQSKIRQFSAIPSSAWDYQQKALVATIVCEKKHRKTAYQRFKSDGPLALLPLADDHLCSIVWSTDPARAENLLSLVETNFNATLTRETDNVLGALRLHSKRFVYPLQTHHAKQYVTHNLALVGDSAHTLHPLAGQGVNLGLLDVAALTEVLTTAIEKHEDIGDIDVLKRYERKRRNHNQLMIWSMEFFKRGFSSSVPVIQGLRNFGLNWVDKQSFIKKIFVKMALGDMHHYPYG